MLGRERCVRNLDLDHQSSKSKSKQANASTHNITITPAAHVYRQTYGSRDDTWSCEEKSQGPRWRWKWVEVEASWWCTGYVIWFDPSIKLCQVCEAQETSELVFLRCLMQMVHSGGPEERTRVFVDTGKMLTLQHQQTHLYQQNWSKTNAVSISDVSRVSSRNSHANKFASAENVIRQLATNQEYSVYEQLSRGVRGLMLDI